MKLAYRYSNISDPEERLEDACLGKALADEWLADLVILGDNDELPEGIPVFGRRRRSEVRTRPTIPYWRDPAVVARMARRVDEVPYADVEACIAEIHATGRGAFVKSTRPKHFTSAVDVGQTFTDVAEDLVYSFIDGGPTILVQEHLRMNYEHRFFVVGGEVVTESCVFVPATPLDHPRYCGLVAPTPREEPVRDPEIHAALTAFASECAKTITIADDYVVDLAIAGDDRRPAIIELNDLDLGQIGLFACDVRALATASRSIVARMGSRPLYRPLSSLVAQGA